MHTRCTHDDPKALRASISHTPKEYTNLLYTYTVYIFFLHPIYFLALLSLSLPVVTQIRGHIAGPPPPFPLRYNNTFVFIARMIKHFLPSTTRVEITCYYYCTHAARRPQQLIIFCIFCIFCNKVKISPRRESKSRTNASSVRG